eukprot:TRINITY_DN12074_c0_g1_i1.p1 TRINITY_DN12074_c0_g1~~TRINITY_DN12074_c0_g1_i1.p1  ORF type:complete len:97 (-),score=11.41 TRINITY_DN12074_c0_g1_i1:19-309(-)
MSRKGRSFFSTRSRVFSAPDKHGQDGSDWEDGDREDTPIEASSKFRAKWDGARNPVLSSYQMNAMKDMIIQCEKFKEKVWHRRVSRNNRTTSFELG